MSAQSLLEEAFDGQLRSSEEIPPYVRQYRFAAHLGRRYASDFAWPEYRLLVEIEGGTFVRGRHTTGAGFHGDCLKYNLAVRLGYQVIRGDTSMVRDGTLLETVAAVVGAARTRIPTAEEDF